MFTAYCPELDVASCGHTPEAAKEEFGGSYSDTTRKNSQARDVERFFGRSHYTVEADVLETEKKIVGFEEPSISVGAL